MNDNLCIICGHSMPEGGWICLDCAEEIRKKDEILEKLEKWLQEREEQ